MFLFQKNSLFNRNSANVPTMDQENGFEYFDHNTNDETSENENILHRPRRVKELVSNSPRRLNLKSFSNWRGNSNRPFL